MTPHTIRLGDITPAHFDVFNRVVEIISALPDDLTCHQVCERIAAVIEEVEWVKGKFSMFDHSWLEFKTSAVIIDAYPWAASGPFMVAIQTGTPWKTLYKPSTPGSN